MAVKFGIKALSLNVGDKIEFRGEVVAIAERTAERVVVHLRSKSGKVKAHAFVPGCPLWVAR